MTALISVRLDDHLCHEMKTKAHSLKLSQTDYIRKAIQLMNDEIEKKARRERLQKASLCVREDSMRINAEFSEIEHDPED